MLPLWLCSSFQSLEPGVSTAATAASTAGGMPVVLEASIKFCSNSGLLNALVGGLPPRVNWQLAKSPEPVSAARTLALTGEYVKACVLVLLAVVADDPPWQAPPTVATSRRML